MENFKQKYFLGANSAEGFLSFFDRCYAADGEWKTYIMKGGPGTGKSSFMKYIAVKAADRGLAVTLCPCSSDPNSLDAVILPEKKIAVLDGTAPHTVDPAYPGVCETVLNVGEFWRPEAFAGKEAAVIDATLRNKALHRTASRYIRAAGILQADNLKTALACTDREKTETYAGRLCKKLIPAGKGGGTEWVRFLSGITPLGVVSYAGSVTDAAENVVIVRDEYGSAADLIMRTVREYALEQGHEIITLQNPLLPSLLIDHILIPKLSLAFVTENNLIRFPAGIKRIHARRFVSNAKLHLSRERMKFNKKAAKQLLLSASETLAAAKTVHDEMERYYIEAMNFEELTAFAMRFTEKLLAE